MRVCDKCMAIYKNKTIKKCVLMRCGGIGNIINIDDLIYPCISTLNLKYGLPTKFSCSGHIYEDKNYGYITLDTKKLMDCIKTWLQHDFSKYCENNEITDIFLYKIISLIYLKMLEINNKEPMSNEDLDNINKKINEIINKCINNNIKTESEYTDSIERNVDGVILEFSTIDDTDDIGNDQILPAIDIRMPDTDFDDEDKLSAGKKHLTDLEKLYQYIGDLKPIDYMLDDIFYNHKKEYKLHKFDKPMRCKIKRINKQK